MPELRTSTRHVKWPNLQVSLTAMYQNTLYKPWGDIVSFYKPRHSRHINNVIRTDTTLHQNIRISHTSRNKGADDSPYNSNLHHLQKRSAKRLTVLAHWPGASTVLKDRYSAGLLASYQPPPLFSNNCSRSGEEITHARVTLHALTKILLTCTHIHVHTQYTHTYN